MFSIYAACLVALAALSSTSAQRQKEYTTPVPILRQINKHNEDGSYSYGYEGADGSFKIETKYSNGEVYGKYGYVDDTGKLREIEYGATKRGFEPVGTGVTVPPPTLNNDNNVDYDDDGQYREDPSVYHRSEQSSSSSRRPANQKHADTFANFQYNHRAAAAPAPAPTSAPVYYQPPTQPYYQPPANSAPVNRALLPQQDPRQFHGHPASNIDIFSGSYTINYSG